MNTTPPPPSGQHQQPPYLTWEDPQPGQGQGPMHQGWGSGHPSAPPVPPQPEAPKKSWFRRHKILTALLAIVVLIVVASLAGGGDEETPTAAEEPAAVAEEAPAAVEAEPAAQEAEQADDAEVAAAAQAEADAEAAAAKEAEEAAQAEADTEAAAAKEAEEAAQAEADAAAPGIGDAVRDGKFEFTVTGIEAGLTTVGEGFTEETPQGQFVMVNITVTNVGDKGTTMFDSAQVLLDEQGRQHNTSSASIWLDEGLWLDEINPGNSMTGILLYDIPTDAVPTTLELHDSMFSGGVTVSLQ